MRHSTSAPYWRIDHEQQQAMTAPATDAAEGQQTYTVRRQYALIPSELTRNPTLSGDARWAMVVALDRPPGWRWRSDDMARRTGMSRHRVLKARRELLEAGWLVEEEGRDARGRLYRATYILDRPVKPTPQRSAVERVKAWSEHERQCAGQTAIDLDGLQDSTQTTPPISAPGYPQPVHDPGDNPDPDAPDDGCKGSDRSTPPELRSDLRVHGKPAGQTESPLPDYGEENPPVITEEVKQHRARESAAQVLDRVTAEFTAQQRHALDRRRHPTIRAIADALDAGWTVHALTDRLTRACADADNPGGMLTWQLGNLPPPEPAYPHPRLLSHVPSWANDRPEDYTRDAGHADAIREQYPWLRRRG